MTIMNVACFHDDALHTVAQAFASGVQKAGEKSEILPSVSYPGHGRFDAAAFYGMSPRHEQIFKDFRRAGKPVVSLDLGYWGRKPAAAGYGYLKVSVNNLHPTSYFQTPKHSPDRFLRFGLPVTGMRKGGNHILFAGIGPKSSTYYKMAHQSWDMDAIAQIRKLTDRTIIYRAKPHHEKAFRPIKGTVWSDPTVSIGAVLENAWCVVSHHSNVTVDGVVRGIPCFAKEGVGIAAGLTDLSKIEDPRILTYTEQMQFLADVGYAQWSVSEISQGYLWSHLRREVI